MKEEYYCLDQRVEIVCLWYGEGNLNLQSERDIEGDGYVGGLIL